MTALDAATYLWLSASLTLFGAALFPLYAGAAAAGRRTLLRALSIVGFASGIAAVSLHLSALGAPITDILASGIGRVWFVQILIGIALCALAWMHGRPAWAAAVGALNVAAFALVGHANAIAGLMGAGAQALHLLAAGAWVGGLAALALALRSNPSLDLVLRFSRVGLACVLTLAATGAYVLFVNTGDALPMAHYAYGRWVSTKIALFATALAIAAFNRIVVTPRGAWRLLAWTIAGELALLALVIAAAVALARTEPYG